MKFLNFIYRDVNKLWAALFNPIQSAKQRAQRALLLCKQPEFPGEILYVIFISVFFNVQRVKSIALISIWLYEFKKSYKKRLFIDITCNRGQ